MSRRPNPAALEQQCTRFNNQFAVGAWVVVRLDNGENVVTRTVHAAEVLSGHSAVIWLEGISGCYALDRVTGINRVLAQ